MTVTYADFFTDVLHQLGIQATPQNLAALTSVSILEGANNRYNPLNSVVQSGNSTSFNSVGVQDYKSYANGVNGTAALLRGSAWQGVVSALRQGDSTGNVLAEFKQVYSGWDPGVQFPTDAARINQWLTSPLGNPGGSGGHPVSSGPTKGKWQSIKGVPIPDPPFVTYTSTGPQAPWTVTNGPKDVVSLGRMVIWLKLFYAGDSNAKTADPASQFPSTPPWTDSQKNIILANYIDTVDTQQETPDPGHAVPGGGVSFNFSSLTAILSWLSSAKNWERIGIGVLGMIVVLVAGAMMFADMKINDITKVLGGKR